MKKSSKRFVISSESINTQGFHVRTEGIDISMYEKNPIMLWMHKRPKGKKRDEILPLGNFVDLAFEDGKLTGIPSFDETDDFAMSLYNKYENGTLRMVSACLIPKEWSKDAAGELWAEKTTLKEVTLCDFGSNNDSLGYSVTLHDINGETIKLTADYLHKTLDELTNQNKEMKKIQLTAESLSLLKLTDQSTEDDINTAVGEIIKLADTRQAKIITLTDELSTANTAKDKAEADLKKLEKEAGSAEIIALVDKAVEDGKITKDAIPHYVELAESNKTAVINLFDKMPKSKSVEEQLSGVDKVDNELLTLTWSELDKKSGSLAKLKELDFPLFKKKFSDAHNGAEWKG